MNGTTNKDRTLYFETLPSNQLDLGIFQVFTQGLAQPFARGLSDSLAAINRHARGARKITRGPSSALDRPRDLTGHAPFRANSPPRLLRAKPKNFRRRTFASDVHQTRRQQQK